MVQVVVAQRGVGATWLWQDAVRCVLYMQQHVVACMEGDQCMRAGLRAWRWLAGTLHHG